MKPVSLLLFSLFSACIFFTGCATPPRATGITATVVGFRSEESTPNRATMTLKFTSENVNPIALTSTSHVLYFGDREVGKAENPNPIGIPPLGTTTQDVTFELENPAAVRQFLSVSDEAPYRLETTLYFTEDDMKRHLKVSADGKVALIGLEAAAR
jgi:LEA14-like dessication related protein